MTDELTVKPPERIDDLMLDGLKIIQSEDVFCFGMDAVLLSKFCSVPKRGKILELCSGNGVISLLLSQRTSASITAIEIQDRLADMAMRSVRINQLDHQIQIIHDDLKQAPQRFGLGTFDQIVVNPPYLPVGWGTVSDNQHLAYARHEIGCTLTDVLSVSAQLLRNGGRVAMVYRASRLMDLLEGLRAHRLEPKRIQFVHGRVDLEPQMVLIEAIRNGKPELRILPPTFLYDQNGVLKKDDHDQRDGSTEENE